MQEDIKFIIWFFEGRGDVEGLHVSDTSMKRWKGTGTKRAHKVALKRSGSEQGGAAVSNNRMLGTEEKGRNIDCYK